MIIGGVGSSQQAGQGIVPQIAQTNKNVVEQANGIIVDDIVDVSLESARKPKDEQNKQTDIEMLLKQLENAKAQGEAMGSMMDERIKCLRIAMNIMAGDKVPEEDLRFLAEKDPELFFRSMSLRRQKEEPEEAERVSEDEEDEGSEDGVSVSSSLGGGGKSHEPAKAEAAAPAAPTAEGGGEASAE